MDYLKNLPQKSRDGGSRSFKWDERLTETQAIQTG